jgi:hypothetical protein
MLRSRETGFPVTSSCLTLPAEEVTENPTFQVLGITSGLAVTRPRALPQRRSRLVPIAVRPLLYAWTNSPALLACSFHR